MGKSSRARVPDALWMPSDEAAGPTGDGVPLCCAMFDAYSPTEHEFRALRISCRQGGAHMTRSLVTGANGFVGRSLVDRLVARGDEVLSLDVQGVAHRDDVESATIDLRDLAAVEAACKGVDAVFHAAAVVDTRTSGRELIEAVNVGGTDNLLRSASIHGVLRFVYVSSASVVYGGADIVNGDETLPYATRPRSHYAATKATAEQHVLSANDRDALLTCALRPDGIYGPGDRRLIPALLDAYRFGINPFYVGHRDKHADHVYVESLVDALLAADQRLEPDAPVAGRAYFVTDGTPCSFVQFAEWTCEAAGLRIPRFGVPYPLLLAAATIGESVPDLVRRWLPSGATETSRFTVEYMLHHHWFSIDRARSDLGYTNRG